MNLTQKRLMFTCRAATRQKIIETLETIVTSLKAGTDFEGFTNNQDYHFLIEDIESIVPTPPLAEQDPNRVTELFLEELDHTPNYAEAAG